MPTTMKALVKTKPEPGIWLEEAAIPPCNPNEVLVKVETTGICGTDLHIFNWDAWAQRNIVTPRIIGHEFVGEIVAVGDQVYGYQTGDRVTAEGHITCGLCRNCRAGKRHLCHQAIGIGGGRDGAFAEYIAVPAANLWPVPDEIPSDIAAILDPFGNAVHSALSFDIIGEDVLITGAGPIGIMAAAVCRFVGARHVAITDVNRLRLDLAKTLGADTIIEADKDSIAATMADLGMTEGFDVGLEMSGHPDAFKDLLDAMAHGGHVALLGFLPGHTQINWDHVLFKGLHLKGIYGREMFETWYKMTQLLRSGLNLAPIITHRFTVDDYAEAFETVRNGQCGKVLLQWSTAS